jgi:hypothetical protein
MTHPIRDPQFSTTGIESRTCQTPCVHSHGISDTPTILSSPTVNDRLGVNASDDCWVTITSIPKMIANFFSRRIADANMFFKAWRSGNGLNYQQLNQRYSEIRGLMSVIQTCGTNRNAVKERFLRLSPQVRELFYDFNENYVDLFVRDPSRIQEIREELLRECTQVLYFQEFFNGVHNNIPPSTTTIPSITTSTHMPSTLGITLPGSTTICGIPGTVPYDQNAVPTAVQQKSAEIIGLRRLFAGLRHPPAVPPIYNDTILAEDFMAIPIFDASHPAVQNALSSGATTAINNRDVRHIFDKDALEAHLRTGRSHAPAKCPTCRHPEHGGILRSNLLIDTVLQDEILQFLRTAVSTSGGTTSTAISTSSAITIVNTAEIPGTIRYVPNTVPGDVQRKADEINSLRPQFEALLPLPPVPAIYNCSITLEVLAIPIFDVTHPQVQTVIRDVANGVIGATTAINNRNIRHLFEKDALENHIRAGTYRAGTPTENCIARCPTCRHPADGSIRRDNLRIDIALQDEILQFMRNAIARGSSTSGS